MNIQKDLKIETHGSAGSTISFGGESKSKRH